MSQSWYLSTAAFSESRTTSSDLQPLRASIPSHLQFPSGGKKKKQTCLKGFFGALGLASNSYCIRYPRLMAGRRWLSCQPQNLIPDGKARLSLLVIRFSLFIPPACQECPKRQDRNLLSCSVTSPVLHYCQNVARQLY